MNKKTRLIIILIGIGLLLLAGILGILYCVITGYNILSWFTTKWAYMVYFLIAIYIGFVLWVLLFDRKNKKL